MKKGFLFILAIIPLIAFSQNREKFDQVNPIYSEVLPLENGLITFSTVVPAEGVGKSELYLRAHDWIIKSFNSPKDAVQLSDKEAGRIVCKTFTTVSAGKGFFGKVTMDLFYILTIETRDDRYKITASNFVHSYKQPVGVVTAEGDNQFEKYFLLKHPTKKEESLNMEMASNLSNFIWSTFELAESEVNQAKNDDW